MASDMFFSQHSPFSWTLFSFHYHTTLIFFPQKVPAHIEITYAAYFLSMFFCLIDPLTGYDPFFLNIFLLMPIALLFFTGSKSHYGSSFAVLWQTHILHLI